jgi:hypothetical protein
MQAPFNFSDTTIDGSALFYTINYTESISNTTCASASILAASCLNQTCEHISIKANISACLTSPSIMMTVFGTNRLGNGSTSTPVLIGNQTLSNHEYGYVYLGLCTLSGTTNRFVDVIVSENSSTIVCTFLDWQNGSNSTCTVRAYRSSINNGCEDVVHSTHDRLYMKTSSSDSDTVTIRITDFQQAPSRIVYCFSVIASNGSFTAEVIGSFDGTGTFNSCIINIQVCERCTTLFDDHCAYVC